MSEYGPSPEEMGLSEKDMEVSPDTGGGNESLKSSAEDFIAAIDNEWRDQLMKKRPDLYSALVDTLNHDLVKGIKFLDEIAWDYDLDPKPHELYKKYNLTDPEELSGKGGSTS